jgi:hypothetical protein
MGKVLELASTLAVAAIAALLVAVFGPTLRMAARQRRDLASDAAIVESLSDKAKDALVRTWDGEPSS